MAYVTRTWKNREVDDPYKRAITVTSIESQTDPGKEFDIEAGDVIKGFIARDEGTVIEAGDAFSAANMNDLESRIAAGFSSLTTPRADEVSYNNSTSGLTATDVQDALDEVVAELGNKVDSSSLAAVATSGDADDVSYDNTVSGLTAVDVQAAVDEIVTALGGKADTSDIPTNVSDLTNDSGFITGDVIAPAFSSSSTYSADDYVMYEGSLYKANNAISVAGDFDPSDWTEVQVVDELGGGGGGSSTLSGLSDVSIVSATDGQVLAYDSATSKWKNAAGGGGSTSLGGLTDVTITSATNGQALIYDDSTNKWVNGNVSGGSTSLSGLTDVTITSASSGQVLSYNGTAWVNGSEASGNVSYNNTTSGMTATNVQDAIDELNTTLGDVETLLSAI